jgi:hypothetical protein
VRLKTIFGQLNRPTQPDPDPYRAFTISVDEFAVAVSIIAADCDSTALEKAMQLQGELRIELWCGSRKVGDVPAIT